MNPENESKGSLIGSIIVVILLIAGAAYLFVNRDSMTTTPAPTATTTTTEVVGDETTTELESTSQSDEIADIEADAAATNFDNLDQESASIEAELQ